MKYIGLDIGDGESAATLVLDGGAMTQEVLTLGSQQSILSVVAMLNDTPVVGSAALVTSNVKERSARFKSRFLSEPDTQDLQRFAQGLHGLMTQTAAHALSGSPGDIRVALGCPAGWDKLTRNRYADIVHRAGFPNVHTVSESRAAYLYVHYDKELQITTDNLKKPCLVIDIGSSTTDFAYIVDGKESNVGIFGQNHLGGGLLDRLILEDAIAGCSASDQSRLAAVFEKGPSWYSYCELEARKQKEAYFLHEAMGQEAIAGTSLGVFYDVNHPVYIPIRLNKETIQRLLHVGLPELDGMSFVEALEDSLEKAVKYTRQTKPEWLILTGGASRMPFFQEACRKAFPDASVLICPQPEFSIARGLGVAAYIDHRLSCFRGELQGFYSGDALAQDVQQNIGKLTAQLVPQIAEAVLKQGLIPAIRLAVQDGIADVDTFYRMAEGYMDVFLQDTEASRPIHGTVQAWISESLTRTQETINVMCASYGVNPAALNLSGLSIKLDFSQLKLPWLFERLLILMGYIDGTIPRAILAALQQANLRGAAARKKLQRQIQKELLQDGRFATQLSANLTSALRDQLDRHIQDVEIMIN